MGVYIVPDLMEGYKIERDAGGWYLMQQAPGGYLGGYRRVRGPYKQSQNAKEWLRRKRFRDVLEARRRGDDVVWPHLLRDATGEPL